MNDQEAFEQHLSRVYGDPVAREMARDMERETWNAALAWLRSQGEPFTYFLEDDEWGVEFNSLNKFSFGRVNGTPLFIAPQPAIPDGWLDRGKAALAECRAADDLWSDDRLLSRLFNAMTAATQPVAPGGWKLVPMEPTPTMLSAGAEGSGEFIEHAHFVWTQMLAAAPEPSK